MTTDHDALVAKSGAAIKRMAPMLYGLGPEVQGAVLADLLAMWLAGHPDFVREQMLAAHTDAVRKLTLVNENILFGPHGHPQNEGTRGTKQ